METYKTVRVGGHHIGVPGKGMFWDLHQLGTQSLHSYSYLDLLPQDYLSKKKCGVQ